MLIYWQKQITRLWRSEPRLTCILRCKSIETVHILLAETMDFKASLWIFVRRIAILSDCVISQSPPNFKHNNLSAYYFPSFFPYASFLPVIVNIDGLYRLTIIVKGFPCFFFLTERLPRCYQVSRSYFIAIIISEFYWSFYVIDQKGNELMARLRIFFFLFCPSGFCNIVEGSKYVKSTWK